MFAVQNRTPFVASLLPAMDPDGGEGVVLIVKGTFSLKGGEQVAIGEKQVPLWMADEYYAEPDKSSLGQARSSTSSGMCWTCA